MKKHGYSRETLSFAWGNRYDYKYLVTGTVEQWKKLLRLANSHVEFTKYVLPYLKVTTGKDPFPSHLTRDYLIDYDIVLESTPNQGEDIMNFLKALYDINDQTKSELNLPNHTRKDWGVLSSRDSFLPTFQALSDFIFNYQDRIIELKSQQRGASILDIQDLKKLASEGTHNYESAGLFPYEDPHVIRAMINNASMTSLKGVWKVIENSGPFYANKESRRERSIGIDMIRNSGLIMRAAIDSHQKKIKDSDAFYAELFDLAWGFIPFKGVTAKIVGPVKSVLSAKFVSMMQTGGEYKDAEKVKAEMARKFINIVSIIQENDDRSESHYYYADITNTFMSALNK